MRRPASAFAALSTLLLATCDLDKISSPSTDGSGQTVNFTITGGNEVILGGTLSLGVSSPADISGTVQQWSSANPATASVETNSGLVTGLAVGVTNINARLLSPELDTGVVKSQLVTVRYKGIRVAAVDSIEGVGLSRPISANGLNASDVPVGTALSGVTWTSRDETIFEVVGTTVVARKAGTHRLIAEFEGMKDSIFVRVRPVAKRIVFPDTHYVADAINANRTVPIRVDDINDTPITTPTITWSVANPTVATIGATTGVIRFLKNDTTRVFATMDSVTRSIKVRVSQVPASIAKTDGDAQSDTVGATLATAPTVTVLDAGGTPVPGAEVIFAVGVGEGAVITDSVRITDANGQATLGSWTLGTNAGEQTVIATAGTATATFSATVGAGTATQLGFTTQPHSVAVGAVMASVVVAVQDAHGNTVDTTGAEVTLALDSNPGGANLAGDLTVETVDGLATFADLAVDASGTGYTLAATATSLAGTTSDTFDAFGAAAQLGFIVQPTSTTAGVVMPQVQVAVLDTEGNIVASSSASIGLSISTNPGGATLGGTTTVSAVNGVATFPNLSLNSAGVGYRLQAAALSGPSLTSALSNTFTIAPVGSAAKLQFSVEPSNVVAGQPITPAVRVKVFDANGALVTTGTHNITLAISTNPGGASLSGTTTQSTSGGEAIFNNISLTKVGAGYRLSATVTGTSITPATSGTFNVTSGGATQMAFLNGPTHTVAGQTMSPVRVALLDVNGNLVTTAPATAISLNVAGATCTSPMSGRGPVNTVGGIATFDALSAPAQMGPCVFQAIGTGFSNVTSTSFSIVPASAAVRLSFTAEPASSTTAGVGMNAGTVSFVNQAGTVVSPPSSTGITISVLEGSPQSFFSGGQSFIQTTTNATFNPMTFNTAGTYRIVATATGYRPDTSAAFTVNPGAANRLGYVVPPTNTAAGVPFATPVQVAIRDQFNNVIPTATNVVRLQAFPNGGGPLARLNNGNTMAEVAAVNGVATFPGLAVYSAGTAWSVNAQAPGTSLFSTSVSIDVERAPLSTFGFTVQPAPSIQAGASINGIQVQAQDSVGNAYTDFADDITISLSPDEALIGTTNATPVSGVATFNGLSVEKAGTYRFSASGGGVGAGESDEFTITPATAVKLGFVRQPTNTFVNAPLSPADTVIVHVQDTFGNRVATGHFVTFAIGNNAGGGSLSGTLGIAAVDGEVRLGNDVTLNAIGSGYTITASTGGLAGATSAAFDVTAHGPATNLAWVVQPSNTALGAVMGPAPQVAVMDDYGNVVSTGADASAEIFITTSDFWGMGGTSNVTALNGVATFNNLIPTSVATDIGLTVFSPETTERGQLAGPDSDPIDVAGGETLLASTDSDIWDMVLSGTTLLWSETGRIQSMAAAGGPVSQLATPVNQPVGIATDGTDVYWIESGALRKVPIGGGLTTTLVTGIVDPHPHLEVDAGFVYFGAGTTLRSVAKSASAIDVSLTNALYSVNESLQNVHGFALDAGGGTLYFSSGKAIWAGPVGGGSATQVVGDSAVTMTLQGGNIYYIRDDGLLRYVSASGGSPTEIASIGAGGRLVSDGTHVYWVSHEAGVWKIPIVGGGTTYRLSTLTIWGVALDATTLYWGRFVPGTSDTQIFSSPK